MQMVDTLTAVFSGVDDGTITTFEAQQVGNFRNRQQQMRAQVGVLRSQLTQGHHRFFGNQQDVYRGLRVNIPKSEAAVVFIDDVGWYFTVDDLQKNRQYGLHGENRSERENGLMTGIVNVDRFECNRRQDIDSRSVVVSFLRVSDGCCGEIPSAERRAYSTPVVPPTGSDGSGTSRNGHGAANLIPGKARKQRVADCDFLCQVNAHQYRTFAAGHQRTVK